MLANQAHWPTYLHLTLLSFYQLFFLVFLQNLFFLLKKLFVSAEKGAMILLDNSKIPNVIGRQNWHMYT